ncbi:MAG: hypothetical protein K0R39_1845 [Symbiobacteriaceae bacterium]|nr:hypothetical protein [Symbiobacteriaceae bacterium]
MSTRKLLAAALSAALLTLAAVPAGASEAPADVNLALNKPYTIEVPYPDTMWAGSEKSWADTANRELTDGINAT